MAIINWVDETETVQGTPVNRLRLMGMQGFYPATTTIEQGSRISRITETSAEGIVSTTININENGNGVIRERFVAADGTTITQEILISVSGTTTTLTETTGT